MNVWQDLLKAALVGTERIPRIELPGDSPDELKQIIESLDFTAPEQALLKLSGILSLWRRAGRSLMTMSGTPMPPSEAEETPECAEPVTQILTLLLQSDFIDVLPELLRELGKRRQRIPFEWIPILLEFGRQSAESMDLIRPVIGLRGRWLAEQKAEWSVALGLNPEKTWQTGTRNERLITLRHIRNENPNRARELLMESWPQENPPDKAAFLAIMALGISPADEPFLESVLDDRRKEVRSVAMELLSQLPESHLVQRMLNRLEPCFVIKKGLLGGITLKVELPAACDKAMTRDGIEAKPEQGFLGERSWWLCQMIGSVPPDTWSRPSKITPRELIKAAITDESGTALLYGWAVAARRFCDPTWLEAFAHCWFDQADLRGIIQKSGLLNTFGRLPAETINAMVTMALRSISDPLTSNHPAMSFLARREFQWNRTTTLVIADTIARTVKHAVDNDLTMAVELSWIKNLAYSLPPELHRDVADRWTTAIGQLPSFAKKAEECLKILGFRHTLHQTFQEHTS